VQTGKVFGVGFGVQSKHSVTSYAKDSRKGQQIDKINKAVQTTHFEQRLHLTEIPSSPGFHEWYACGHTHLIHMSSGVYKRASGNQES
jgi:hypothetical protein